MGEGGRDNEMEGEIGIKREGQRVESRRREMVEEKDRGRGEREGDGGRGRKMEEEGERESEMEGGREGWRGKKS